MLKECFGKLCNC